MRKNACLHTELALAGLALGILGAVGAARADTIDVGNPDWAVRWDNTLKYSNAFRLKGRSDAIAGNAMPRNSNVNDGDNNFARGLISNRTDLLSELDIVYQDRTGLRISGAGWYDTVYANRGTANDNPAASNNLSAGFNQFPTETKVLHGKNVELLDAFVFHKFELSDTQNLSVRAGRFAQIYGETLFFGDNGIAAAQAPVNVAKLLSVPNSQFKEIIMPVGQVAASWTLGDGLTLGGYYQFEYRASRLPGVGSYFSTSDVVGPGAETLFLPGSTAGAGAFLGHGKDLRPSDQGQGGLQLRWKATDNWEFGLYGANYHEKTPSAVYLRFPGGAVPTRLGSGLTSVDVGEFSQVTNQNVQTYGASFSTAVDDTNLSGELSVRHNQSLATSFGNTVVPAPDEWSNKDNTAYLRGNTFHANMSAIALLNENSLWDGAALVGELGYNRVLSIGNEDATRRLDPNATRSALAVRMALEPSFFQVIPNLDLSVPVGIGYGIYGRSALGPFLGGFNPEGVMDVSIGVKADYAKVWKASLTYTAFLGPRDQVTTGAQRGFSYKQASADRDFVAFSLSRTF